MKSSNSPLRSFKQGSLLLSLLFLCIDISTAGIIQLPQPPASPANLVSPQNLTAGEDSHYHCTRQETFNPSRIDGNDCLKAIEMLRRIEDTTNDPEIYQFREPRSQKVFPQRDQMMPRKYVYRKSQYSGNPSVCNFEILFILTSPRRLVYAPTHNDEELGIARCMIPSLLCPAFK